MLLSPYTKFLLFLSDFNQNCQQKSPIKNYTKIVQWELSCPMHRQTHMIKLMEVIHSCYANTPAA